MTTGQPEGGPAVWRILVGAELRQLREAKNITREEAAYQIRGSESKISRLELGRVSFKERDVADLLTFYGVSDNDKREKLLYLVGQANQPGWWREYSDILPNWFEAYVGLEVSASRIRTYELQFIPGLLQTEAYARAVTTVGHMDAASEEIERRVDLRRRRQRVLTRTEDPPHLWAVIDEAALRRPIGGHDVMRAQLEHLLSMSKLPNITIQLMPFRFGGHAAEGGPFTILRFPDTEVHDIVYVEQLTRALYLDEPKDIDQYTEAMTRLSVDSENPDATARSFSQILHDT